MKGTIEKDVLPYVIDTIPAELTLTDENDLIIFWNEPKTKIFPRADNILGMDIRKCHPEKSQEELERLLNGMHTGSIDMEIGTFEYEGQNILIQYNAIRNSDGKYLGCLEVCRLVDSPK